MTDIPDEPTADDHLDDEALSALIDGQLSTGAGHASTCVTCGERLVALRSAAIAVRQPVAVDPERREATILAALAAADEHRRPDRVPSLAARARARRLPVLAGAAAAAVALLVVLPLARDDGGSNQVATPTADQGDDTASLRSAAPEAADLPAAAKIAGGAESSPGEHLGELAGVDLAERLSDVPRSPGEAAAACEDAARSVHAGARERTMVAAATWNGAEAQVIVFADDDGEVATVLTLADCAVVHSARL